jgi:hypothetical protein
MASARLADARLTGAECALQNWRQFTVDTLFLIGTKPLVAINNTAQPNSRGFSRLIQPHPTTLLASKA